MFIDSPLCGERIIARNSLKADLPALTAMWLDEENGKYMSDPTWEYVDSRFQAALDAIEVNQKGYFLTAQLRGSGEIVGSGCIFPDETGKGFDIGYCIRKDCWRKGLGTELLDLLVSWVFSHGGTEVTAEVAKENTASNRLLLRRGFQAACESSFKKYNMDITYESTVYRLTR